MLKCVILCFVFRFVFCFLFLFFFHPFFVQAKKKPISETESLDQEEPKVSLNDLLNDTNQLKNDIKRDLAKKKQKAKKTTAPSSQQKMVRFGNMGVRISERKAEETLKDVPESGKRGVSKEGSFLNLRRSKKSKEKLRSAHQRSSTKSVSKASKEEKPKLEEEDLASESNKEIEKKASSDVL